MMKIHKSDMTSKSIREYLLQNRVRASEWESEKNSTRSDEK